MPSLSRRRHAPKGPIKTPAESPPNVLYVMDDRQCTAKSKQSGVRCRRAAIPGGRVCHIHGGNIPHVREAALERLRALQHPAIDRIAKLIDQEQFPTVSYAASKDVLDRTLGRAKETLDVTHSGEAALMALLNAWKQQHRETDE